MKTVIELCVATLLLAATAASIVAQERAFGRVRVGTKAWATVYSTNRNPESACTFDAITVTKSLESESPQLFQGAVGGSLNEPVEIEMYDGKKSLTFVYELQGVSVVNTRMLEGGKERVTLRYKKCTIKARRAS